jgi:hypothetical protein
MFADGCQSMVADRQRPITKTGDEPSLTLGIAEVKGQLPKIAGKCGRKPEGEPR